MIFIATRRTRIAGGIGVSASKVLKEKLRSRAEDGEETHPFSYAVLSLEQERYRNQRENNGEEARQKKTISLILIRPPRL